MTAPRAREQSDPPAPPDRRPPRRGGGSSPSTYASSAAGGLRGLLRPARRTALAAAGLVLGSLALAPPAQAQSTTEIWSATMTPAVITTGTIGYSQPGGDGTLSDRTFSHAGTDYAISEIFTQQLGTTRRLHFALNKRIRPAAVSDLTLVVGSDEFVLVNGTISPSGISVSWNNPGLSWSAGTDVSLSLKAITGRPEPLTADSASAITSGGSSLALLFNETLDSDNLPPASAFSVTADGSPVGIGGVIGDNRLISLVVLSPLIGQGQTVELEYTDPTTGDDSNAIQDTGGLDASSFTATITNGSTVTLPALSEAEVLANGQVIALTFSRNLDFSGTFTATIRDAFSVTVDGTANAVTGFSGSGDTATLTMADTIEGGQTVVVGYDRSDAGGEALADDDDDKKLVADFTTGADSVPAVTNNSMLTRARLASATVNATGTQLTLTFDKDLNTVSAGIVSQFTITVDGAEIDTIGSQGFSSADDNFKLLFRSSNPIYKDEAVVVTYEKPAGSDGLTDEEDDLSVVSFTTGENNVPAVTNNSTVVAPPRLTSAEVQARGERDLSRIQRGSGRSGDRRAGAEGRLHGHRRRRREGVRRPGILRPRGQFREARLHRDADPGGDGRRGELRPVRRRHERAGRGGQQQGPGLHHRRGRGGGGHEQFHGVERRHPERADREHQQCGERRPGGGRLVPGVRFRNRGVQRVGGG